MVSDSLLLFEPLCYQKDMYSQKDMKRFTNILIASLFTVVLVNVSGCSDGRLNTEPVSGVITLDGVPLAEAMVNFRLKVPGEGAAGFARTNERGEYRLQTMAGRPDAGTLPGEYAVTVVKYKLVPTGRMITDNDTGERVEELENVFIFPGMAVYADVETTPFSATVVRGRNRFDFDLSSQPQ